MAKWVLLLMFSVVYNQTIGVRELTVFCGELDPADRYEELLVPCVIRIEKTSGSVLEPYSLRTQYPIETQKNKYYKNRNEAIRDGIRLLEGE